jgi:hypothetical protein
LRYCAASDVASGEHLQYLPLYDHAGLDAAVAAERERCAKAAGEYAKKWWSRHSATNRHMTTTREAHEDFCALQRAILRA